MKNKSGSAALLTITLLCAGFTSAQESINSYGGDATGSGGSVAYTAGQLVYTTVGGNTGSIAQGVQHAYEIFTVSMEEFASGIVLSAYPNPTTENLVLQTESDVSGMLSYQLTDEAGRLLNSGFLTGKQVTVKMEDLPGATYFIHILNQENKTVRLFKIIKTQ